MVDANIAAHHGSRHMASSPHYELGGGHQRDMYLGDKGSPQRMSPVQKVVILIKSFYCLLSSTLSAIAIRLKYPLACLHY